MTLNRPMLPEPSPSYRPTGNNSNWDHGLRSGGFLPQNHLGDERHRNYNNHCTRNPRSGGSHGGNFHHDNYNNHHNRNRGRHGWCSYGNFSDGNFPLHQPLLLRFPPWACIMWQPCFDPNNLAFGNQNGFCYTIPLSVPMPRSNVSLPFLSQVSDPQLSNRLLQQIEYYFSYENLCKDFFLRKNMEEEGWVPVSLIASFKRVEAMTNDVMFVLDTMRTSLVVEVQGNKLRRRNDWIRWPLPLPLANQRALALSLEGPSQSDTMNSHLKKNEESSPRQMD